jgi:hypothetical protein
VSLTYYGNMTGVRALDAIGDDEQKVREVLRERDPSGMYRWRYTALLAPGWSNEHGEHFVEGFTAGEVIEGFKKVQACACEECKGEPQ